jgi:hypothetical protein
MGLASACGRGKATGAPSHQAEQKEASNDHRDDEQEIHDLEAFEGIAKKEGSQESAGSESCQGTQPAAGTRGAGHACRGCGHIGWTDGTCLLSWG